MTNFLRILQSQTLQLGFKSMSEVQASITERCDQEMYLKAVRIKVLWTVVTILSASGMWDHFVAQYTAVFDVTLATSGQQVLGNFYNTLTTPLNYFEVLSTVVTGSHAIIVRVGSAFKQQGLVTINDENSRFIA